MTEPQLLKHISPVSRWTYNLLTKWGVDHDLASFLNLFALVFALIVLVYVVHRGIRRVLRLILIRIGKTYPLNFFRHLQNNRLPHYIASSVVLVFVQLVLPVVLADFPEWIKPANIIADCYMVFVMIWILMTLIKAGADDFRNKPAFRGQPIDSYLQVIRLILFLIGAVVIYSNLTGQSIVAFFTAMGAISAVLLLMFKDTIMGFVASIQITANDTVRIGDWITMSKFGADGDVIEINLTTVKVQNFDKTITTIPTYSLISDSFQNWRGMTKTGGRRIKRAIYIKQSSIRFITPEEVEQMKQIQSLTSYIEHRQKDIDKSNERSGADKSLLVNGRNLTNAGLFRKYIDNYLSSHTGTHKNMSMMVRHLAPTPYGLPLEIYVFAGTTKWIDYEHIMADIFDHVISAAPYFNLQIGELDSTQAQGRISPETLE
ncbi:mechanosensitive ion channel family protein [Pedobacter antarcticus]|uniref:mechanosensitive ion channel family protein n=1 Tax=Pedobacter antarcticus TaxID=34086 RepID=UPI0029302C17|nr:mechanosensitive ion channel domain-containing protein [Pedobacter antarcticus]